jgi:hypothetical protein
MAEAAGYVPLPVDFLPFFSCVRRGESARPAVGSRHNVSDPRAQIFDARKSLELC